MTLPFVSRTYRGQGRWIDQKTEGAYRAQYTISDGENFAKVHVVERTFLKPDGSTAYEERTRVSFEPRERGAVHVQIHGERGTVSGPGYAFEHGCHYDIDVTADNHLEFTFHSEGTVIRGLGSATNNGNRTYWEESLVRA